MKYLPLLALFLPIVTDAGVPKITLVEQAMNLAAISANIPINILKGVCWVESRHNPNAFVRNDAGSPSYGLCQLKLKTARWLGFKGPRRALYSPVTNADYAARYLKYQYGRYHGNWIRAISAYNAGRALTANLEYVNLVFKHVAR